MTGRTVGPFAMAATATVALMLVVAVTLPPVGPWVWLATGCPVGVQLIDRLLAAGHHRRDQHRDLSMADLRGVDLRGADLASSDLRNKDLSSARLVEANLTGADLTDATLVDARFHRADLSQARLEGARCDQASFYRARLTGARLDHIQGLGTSFDEADLRGASLTGADLRRASFAGADLRGTDLTGATIGSRALARAITDATTTRSDGTPAPDAGRGPTARASRPVGRPRLLTWQLVRPTVIGLGGALIVVGAVASTSYQIGDTGIEIAADLSGRPVPNPNADSDSGTGRAIDTTPRRSTGRSSGATTGPTTTIVLTEGGSDASTGQVRELSSGDLTDVADDGPTDRVADIPPPPTTEAVSEPEPAAATPAVTPAETAATTTITTTTPAADRADGLVEVEVPGASEAVQRTRSANGPATVRVVMSSDGGPSTATFRSAIGQGDLTVAGQEGLDIDASVGGAVVVEVAPDGPTTVASCAIVVDGVQRSVRQGFAGETITCEIDLDRS